MIGYLAALFIGIPVFAISARTPIHTIAVSVQSDTPGFLRVYAPTTAPRSLWVTIQLKSHLEPAEAVVREYRLPLRAGRYSALRIEPGQDAGHYAIGSIDILRPNGSPAPFDSVRRTHTPGYRIGIVERRPDPDCC